MITIVEKAQFNKNISETFEGAVGIFPASTFDSICLPTVHLPGTCILLVKL